MVKSYRKTRSSSKNQKTLDQYEKITLLEQLTEKQLKIIKFIDEGWYQAAIARHLHVSKSYICRFCKELRQHNLITAAFINPINRRATSYRVSKELGEMVAKIETGTTTKADFTLCTPHRVRYQRNIISMNSPVVLNVSRFAAAKFKHKKSYKMNNGMRHIFEMTHEQVGKIGIIVHPNSIEYYQKYRHHIIAPDIDTATQQLSMALEEATARFRQEQGWCGVDIEYGTPKLTTSPDYAFPSKYARALTDAGQSKLQFSNGMEVDKSLEAKQGIKTIAEIEGRDEEVADIVDRGLRNAANLHTLIPDLVRATVQSEMKSAFDPLRADIHAMSAHIEAGSTSQFKINEQNQMILTLLKITNDLRDEIKAMKGEKKETLPEKPKVEPKEPEPVIKTEKVKREWQSLILTDFSAL